MEITEEGKKAIHIAQAIAKENSNTNFGPAHLLKGLLHKEVGLKNRLIEWGEDFYFIEEWAEVRLESYPKGRVPAEIKGDELISQVLNEAESISLKLAKEKTDPLCLLASLSTPGVGFTFEQLKTFPLKAENIIAKASDGAGNYPEGPQLNGSPFPAGSPSLLRYCSDMREESRQPEAEAFVGRKQELISIAEILCRRSKPNVIITGDAGVGKTALVEGLANAINEEQVPASLRNARIFRLNLPDLLGGISYKSEAEDRFRNIIGELKKFDTPILFIDDIHELFDKALQLQGLLNILKAELSRRSFILMGTSLTDEFRKRLEPESSLMRWCEVLAVSEPEPDEAAEIVKGTIASYAAHHKVELPEEVVEEAVKLSKRYIKERKLPDSAIDVLDRSMAALQFMHHMAPGIAAGFREELHKLKEKEAAAEDFEKLHQQFLSSLNYLSLSYLDVDPAQKKQEAAGPEELEELIGKMAALENTETVEVQLTHIAATISKICGIPAGKILAGERERLIKMEAHLQDKVIGQDQAVKVLTDAILESRSGLSRPGQPIGSFFLLGPTGTGKTELAKQLADFLFQSSSALIRFDMSEFKEEHSAALLYGAPPGYVGYEEGGLLVNKIRQQPYSVVLFDEIEKAHSSVFDIFLQILDEGKIHDKLGRTGDFSNAVVLFTSNIGSQHIVEAFNGGNALPSQTELSTLMSRHFRPEFLGRLSGIVPFAPIQKENVKRILKLQLLELEESLQQQNIELRISDAAADKLATDGYSPEYGARPLRGVIRSNLKTPLSRMIIAGQLTAESQVVADIDEQGNISLNCQEKPQQQEQPTEELVQA